MIKEIIDRKLEKKLAEKGGLLDSVVTNNLFSGCSSDAEVLDDPPSKLH